MRINGKLDDYSCAQRWPVRHSRDGNLFGSFFAVFSFAFAFLAWAVEIELIVEFEYWLIVPINCTRTEENEERGAQHRTNIRTKASLRFRIIELVHIIHVRNTRNTLTYRMHDMAALAWYVGTAWGWAWVRGVCLLCYCFSVVFCVFWLSVRAYYGSVELMLVCSPLRCATANDVKQRFLFIEC